MNKKAILLLAALFALPVILATLMHSQWFEWRPASTRNHGELIVPVIQWPTKESVDVTDQAVDLARLQGRWHLVYHTTRPCDADCLEDLYWLRQVRLSQDRHVPEIGLLLIHEPSLGDNMIGEIQALSEAFVIIDGPDATGLRADLPLGDSAHARYIIDPMGNIMMRYDPDQPPDGIRKDLGRLLTWTKPQPRQ